MDYAGSKISNFAKDHAGQIVGGVGGLAIGGFPGAALGARLGDLYDDKAVMSNTDLAKGLVGAALDAYGNPVASAAYDVATTAIDPNTKLSSHLAGVGMAALASHKLAPGPAALVGAKFGQGLGSMVPGGKMNPTNSDASTGISSPGGSSPHSFQGEGSGTHTTALVGPEGSSVKPQQMMADRFKNVRNARQWDNYQKRFHAA
ncbi:MAG: hypothetical protein GY737_13830 [Desulfobacteraceae bacterium]|nr:hypothetical protein [Desulfobacteraceae bacterium]